MEDPELRYSTGYRCGDEKQEEEMGRGGGRNGRGMEAVDDTRRGEGLAVARDAV